MKKEKQIELLKKLKALAEKGFGGEKVNAKAMLDALMLKYGITEEDLEKDKKISRKVTIEHHEYI